MATEKPVSIRLSSEDLDRLQRLADKADITRHKLIRRLITTGLETMEDLEKVGVLRAAILARNAGEYLKSFDNRKSKDHEKDSEKSA